SRLVPLEKLGISIEGLSTGPRVNACTRGEPAGTGPTDAASEPPYAPSPSSGTKLVGAPELSSITRCKGPSVEARASSAAAQPGSLDVTLPDASSSIPARTSNQLAV